MNDIGKLLSEKRDSLGIDLDQAARETNIAKRYLEGLETDDYKDFPAEAYIIGFLRNYSEYLGLDGENVIKQYKQAKIQDTSLPPDALFSKQKIVLSKNFITTLLIIAVVAIAGVFIYFATTKLISRENKNNNEASKLEQNTDREPVLYELKDDQFEKRIFEGDSLKIILDEVPYILEVEKVSPSLILKTELGLQVIDLGQTINLDLNNDLMHDIEITVEDIDKNNAEAGCLISILAQGRSENEDGSNEDLTASDSPNSNSGKPLKSYKVLFESGSAYSVTLSATFRAYCLFRHEIDKTAREERYYQKAEQLTIQAKNGFRIWASNGNAVKMQLVAGGKTVDLELSRPGEVIVKDLKWIRDDESKRYQFIVTDVD